MSACLLSCVVCLINFRAYGQASRYPTFSYNVARWHPPLRLPSTLHSFCMGGLLVLHNHYSICTALLHYRLYYSLTEWIYYIAFTAALIYFCIVRLHSVLHARHSNLCVMLVNYHSQLASLRISIPRVTHILQIC